MTSMPEPALLHTSNVASFKLNADDTLKNWFPNDYPIKIKAKIAET